MNDQDKVSRVERNKVRYLDTWAVLLRTIVIPLFAAICATATGQSVFSSELRPPVAIVELAAPGAMKAVDSGKSSEQTPPHSAAQAHKVTLSWNAVAPSTSPSLKDRVTTYRVYRSMSKHVKQIPANRIDCEFVAPTSCVDINVEPGRTYYYVATTVVKNGKYEIESVCSKPIKVKVPSP